jgi:hypothetical protein
MPEAYPKWHAERLLRKQYLQGVAMRQCVANTHPLMGHCNTFFSQTLSLSACGPVVTAGVRLCGASIGLGRSGAEGVQCTACLIMAVEKACKITDSSSKGLSMHAVTPARAY